MRTLLLCLALSGTAVSLALPEPAQAQSTEADKTLAKLQKTWRKVLLKAGYRPEVTEYGNLVFKRDYAGTELTWMVQIDAEDPQFFRITLPNVWPIEEEGERERVLEACNEASAQIKVAKLYIVDDAAWVSLELLLDKPKDAASVLDRSLELMDDSLTTFVQKMQALEQ